jgi:hypothetical protein
LIEKIFFSNNILFFTLRSTMTFVYETKNKEVKNYANVTNQRINIAQSLSYKAAMRFNYFLLEHAFGFLPTTTHEKALLKMRHDVEEDDWFKKMSQVDRAKLFPANADELLLCKEIEHKGSSYKLGHFIVDNQYKPQNIFKIENIAVVTSEYFFIAERIDINEYDHHYCSYNIGGSSGVNELIRVETIRSLPYDIHTTNNGDKYFKIKFI